MSRVSIIIPAYNQACYLTQALESALQQTHPDLEVVVVDDGSTDTTPEVTAAFAGRPGVRLIRQENRGLPGARNRGLAESTGDYVCFLDADDYFAPAKIAEQAAVLDENPDVGLVYCDIVTVNPDGQPEGPADPVAHANRELSGNLFSSLLLGGYFPPHTVLIRRRVLDHVGAFDPTLGGHADYDLWLRVAGAGHRAVFLAAALAFYRVHPASMSRDGDHMNASRLATFRKIARLHPDAVAEGVNRLQQSNQDFHQANQWLHARWQEVSQRRPEFVTAGPEGAETYSFITHLNEARRAAGQPDQVAVWDATIDGLHARAIWLHPPAVLTFTLPTGARGRFLTAVAIHPDAWDRPNGGGCEFHLKVDGRLVFVVALDPAHLPGDRHWHDVNVDLPESPQGPHQISFETRGLGGSTECRWALWRAPRFTWSPGAAPTP